MAFVIPFVQELKKRLTKGFMVNLCFSFITNTEVCRQTGSYTERNRQV